MQVVACRIIAKNVCALTKSANFINMICECELCHNENHKVVELFSKVCYSDCEIP